MLCTLVAALAIAQSQPQKTVLPNGAVVYAERTATNGFTLQLFVSCMGAKEQAPGLRHLIEHLVAKGRTKDIDAKLESRGLTLSAETLRDGIRFEIEGASENAPTAIEAVKELLTLREITDEEVAKELKVIEQERAVRSSASKIVAGLWKQAFDEPDLFGTNDGLAKTSAADVRAGFASLFRPESIAVAIVGGIDAGASEKALIEALKSLPVQGPVPRANRTLIDQRQQAVVPGAAGSGRAVAIGPMSRTESLAVIAAALAIANETPGAQVLYTPSAIGGLVCIVHTRLDGFADTDRLVTNEAPRLYPSGLAAVRLWADTADASSRIKSRMYAQQLTAETYFRMEDLKLRAATVSQADFIAALQKFRSGACVRVGGVR